jgi:2-polyprenyl-3-methyl-5-hydroxy-6-metoxy-1,4-benzoquinol methylase
MSAPLEPSMPKCSQHTVLETLPAYDALAPWYKAYSQTRLSYLHSIERLITARIAGARSLLDVGAGDGSRALRIAASARISEIVLVEPCEAMRDLCVTPCDVWTCKASEIRSTRRFDVIICLWNVLGHIQAHERRASLVRLRQMLGPSGTLFLDVNHRYNAAEYGWAITCIRRLRDFLSWSETNGDVVLDWTAGERLIRTRGHVFTLAELNHLFFSASLQIQRLWVVDYTTGAERGYPCFGNLLYQLSA